MITCNCFLVNTKLQELDIPCEDEKARTSFLIEDIQCVRECFDDTLERISAKRCIVYFRGGSGSLEIDKSFDEITKLMRLFE